MNTQELAKEKALNELSEVSDEKVIERIELREKDDLLLMLAENSQELELASNGIDNRSIEGWYNAYLMSPEFSLLNREMKKKTIEQYRQMSFIIDEIFNFLNRNKLGIFNNDFNLRLHEYSKTYYTENE